MYEWKSNPLCQSIMCMHLPIYYNILYQIRTPDSLTLIYRRYFRRHDGNIFPRFSLAEIPKFTRTRTYTYPNIIQKCIHTHTHTPTTKSFPLAHSSPRARIQFRDSFASSDRITRSRRHIEFSLYLARAALA